MQYAFNSFNERVQAEPGVEAICPGCDGEVIPKCGEIKIHHFAHKSASECEGSKGESPWHRAWKERFPEDSREKYIINLEGKKRIADVRFCGHVFEFQTQLPGGEEMRNRQNFWKAQGYRFAWIFKMDKSLITKKLAESTYRVWNFSEKLDQAVLPFFLDDPASGWCLRVDEYERIGSRRAECTGQFMKRETADVWIGPLNE